MCDPFFVNKGPDTYYIDHNTRLKRLFELFGYISIFLLVSLRTKKVMRNLKVNRESKKLVKIVKGLK